MLMFLFKSDNVHKILIHKTGLSHAVMILQCSIIQQQCLPVEIRTIIIIGIYLRRRKDV